MTLWPPDPPFDFLATPAQQRQFEPLISITLLLSYYRHGSSLWPSYKTTRWLHIQFCLGSGKQMNCLVQWHEPKCRRLSRRISDEIVAVVPKKSLERKKTKENEGNEEKRQQEPMT